MARPQRHGSVLACLSLVLLLLLLPATITAASYSSVCRKPAPQSTLPAGDHSRIAAPTLPMIITGHFSGGEEDLRFAPDESHFPRSFTFNLRPKTRATIDPAVKHVFATLNLVGTHRSMHHRRSQFVSFDLEGYYYSSTAESSSELCMVGSGSYARDDGFGVALLSDAVLRLHVPRPANLSRPFVTGRIHGAEFGDVTLVAYADHIDYKYGEAASCPAAAAQDVRRAELSCRRLKALLRDSYSYDLEYGQGGHVTTVSSPLRLPHWRMRFDQIRCDGNGVLRAYIAFDTNTNASYARWYSNSTVALSDGLEVGDEALVAEGFWDSSRSRSQLCLRACRVVRAGSSRADLAVRECGVGVSLWFPTVWSIHDRSVASGMIWNTSKSVKDKTTSGVISVSRSASYRDDLSYITYNYTRVEEAKKHYVSMPALSKGRYPGNYSFQDFAFSFYVKINRSASAYGYASPVSIGSAVVKGQRLMAFEGFYSNWTAETKSNWLLNVSYDLQLHYFTTNFSNQQHISAEGVYDTETGFLCMVGCQLISSNGSSAAAADCEVLVTAQFAPVDAEEARDRVSGTISSMRKKGDPLFFEALDFTAEGMYVLQAEESVARMDMERVMLVVSMTLACVFTGLQLRHVKRHPEALPATSVTMLVVLAAGYAVPLMLNLDLEAMFSGSQESSDHRRSVQLTDAGLRELNELVLRVSSLLAFVLQLRLLQLALASRQRPAADEAGGDKQAHEDTSSSSSSSSDAEKSTLWICLPLYALGAVVVWIVHTSAFDMQNPLHRRPQPLSHHLAAYAGLVLDGFLLPQVVWNAFAGSTVHALSPWFYAGGSLVRAAPHAYDVFRRHNYVPSWAASYVYASPREDLFGVAWDVAVPCVAAVLVLLVFLQQRLGGAFLCGARGRRTGGYEMASTLSS